MDLVEQIKSDYRQADLSAADKAMLDFAVRLTQSPDCMRKEDVGSLRQHGFRDRDILEITHIVGYFNYINRVADALGIDPEPGWKNRD